MYAEREAEPQFSQPVRQIVSMLIAIGLFAIGAYLALPRVGPVFFSNPWLNGIIIFVFVIGVLACFWQVLQLIASVSWIEGFALHRPGHDLTAPPRLLAPLATLLRSRGARMQIGSSSARSILDSVATRIDELRDITRYITSLLIFLGLLGTFYGLATTVPAIVDTIRSLAQNPGESPTDMFNNLIHGLERQLGGMGTAFASSLLGLTGSLVVGLLELFVSHGQNRFYRELEEWLSTITRVGFSSDADGSPEQGIIAALGDQMAEQLDALHTMLSQADLGRAQVDQRLGVLADSVDRLTRRLEEDLQTGTTLTRVAESQERLASAIEEFAARPQREADAMEAEARMRLRSIDTQLLRLLEELSVGRQESVSELRRDLAKLTRVIEYAAGDVRDTGTGS